MVAANTNSKGWVIGPRKPAIVRLERGNLNSTAVVEKLARKAK